MFSATTPLEIVRHPANDSTAKYHWSFGKAPRFRIARPACQTISYDEGHRAKGRSTSLGVGKRREINEGVSLDVPPPTKYDPQAPKIQAPSFTENRDKLVFMHFQKMSDNTPAPSAYNPELVGKPPAYSMRPKTAYPRNYFLPNEANKLKDDGSSPAPCHYQTIDCIGNNYVTSKHPNNKQRSFIGGKRFKSPAPSPGPFEYKNSPLEPDGAFLLSTMRSSGRRTMLQGRRKSCLQVDNKTPGPGSYRLPSDFGHYDTQQSGTPQNRSPQKFSRPQTAR